MILGIGIMMQEDGTLKTRPVLNTRNGKRKRERKAPFSLDHFLEEVRLLMNALAGDISNRLLLKSIQSLNNAVCRSTVLRTAAVV